MTSPVSDRVRDQLRPPVQGGSPPVPSPTLVETARAIATWAHAGQVDKAGEPYIGHPARVAAIVRATAPGDVHAEATAWLHDVLEDSDLTGPDLVARGIPIDVVVAVEALSTRDDEGPEDYIGRVRAVPLAVVVKHADLQDNTRQVRLGRLAVEHQERLRAKYARYLELLTCGTGG